MKLGLAVAGTLTALVCGVGASKPRYSERWSGERLLIWDRAISPERSLYRTITDGETFVLAVICSHCNLGW